MTPTRKLATILACTALLMCLGLSSWALDICLVGAETSNNGFVHDYLWNTGLFDSIDYFDARTSTPTVAELSNYDAVLAWANQRPANRTALGDNLADYVDAGGGVVLAGFAHSDSSYSIGGRIISAYSPFNVLPKVAFANVSLGSFDASSPIMDGVTSVTGYYRDTVSVKEGATWVADWSNGIPLAAWQNGESGGRVVGISMYTGAANIANMSGQYPQMFANALVFSTQNAVPEPSSILVLGGGLIGLLGGLRRKR